VVKARGDRHAVNEILRLGGAPAVDAEVARPAHLHRGAVYVGRQLRQRQRVASRGQLFQPPPVHHQPRLRVLRPQHGYLADHRDVLGGRADLNLQVQPHPVSHAQHDALAFQLLQSRERCRQAIGARDDVRHQVAAFGVAHRSPLDIGVHIDHPYGHTGHYRPGVVQYRPADGRCRVLGRKHGAAE